jgi:tetratricopeptide (TPR) repeat protein
MGDLQHEARALNALGSVANLERDYLGAAELFTHALEIRETIGDRVGIGASLMSLAQSYGYMGDYGRVEALLHQALEIQQAMRNRWEEMLIHNELGILYTTVGQYDKAFVHLEQAMERARLIESDIGAAYILCNLGQTQRDAGRTQEALATLQRGLLLAQAQGDIHLEAIYLNDWALTSLRAGAYQEAVAQAQHSRELFLELDQPLSLTAVYACLAAAYLGAGDPAAAEASALEALTLLDGCGGEGPDFPQRDYWYCARTLAALGRNETARRAAEQAALLLRQRADRISDETMRGTYLTQVAVHVEITASVSA